MVATLTSPRPEAHTVVHADRETGFGQSELNRSEPGVYPGEELAYKQATCAVP